MPFLNCCGKRSEGDSQKPMTKRGAPGTLLGFGRLVNCILETEDLTTESLTVFLRQEMWPLSTQSGVCANTIWMFMYLLPACGHCLSGRGRKYKKKILFLFARHTQSFTRSACIFCLKEQVPPPLCWASQRVQKTESPTSFIQQPFTEH